MRPSKSAVLQRSHYDNTIENTPNNYRSGKQNECRHLTAAEAVVFPGKKLNCPYYSESLGDVVDIVDLLSKHILG